MRRLAAVAETPAAERAFLDPPAVWIEQGYESASILDAYSHIAPVEGRRILQLGGRGHHAVKFLLAGARESVVISPMIQELAFARSLGNHYGVGDRLHCVAAVAEELPFAADTFDAIFAGGCIHHTVTSMALPECVRVLRRGGKFAAVEPWRAPFYDTGIRLFGKSEPNPFCRPMTHARAEPLHTAFDSAEVIHHGATTRYPLKALARLGLPLRPSLIARIGRCDDAVSSLVPGLRKLGSSVALLGTVEGPH
jgi:SAM-dependent methyltransferase